MQAEQKISPYDVSPSAKRLTAAAGVAAIAGGSAFIAYFDPSRSNFFPVCPLYTLTGFACPGCGLTRGFHALFHGDIIPALDFNLLIPIWALVLSWVFISLVLTAVRGYGLPAWKNWPRTLWTFLIVLLVFGALRNLPWWPFTILFP